MQPSSLIFLVLVAIWAAYLLQHWVRRREHLATARSVDRFSLAMRVLERRASVPVPDASALCPRSYDMSPARPSRAEVAVKRAKSSSPEVLTAPAATAPTVRPTRIFHVLAGVSARRVRGVSLLVSLLLTLVVPSLAAFSAVPWWSVLVVVAVLVADVVWLRHMAVSERASGREHSRGSADRASGGSMYVEDAPDFGAEAQSPAGSDSEATDRAPLGAAEIAEPTEPAFESGSSGWEPVPVPPPTYTLKARAADTTVAVPVPATDRERDRYSESAGPWSLDGMLYDCELDEVVERRSATGA